MINALLFALTLAHAQRSPVPQEPVAQWKSDSALVFLHRAACMVAPENTVPALEAAVRQGADGVEIDIRMTSDGELVLYHDDWVLRQRGTAGKIEEMTLAETQKLDVGERWGPKWRGTRLPLFEDALRFARANDLRLYLDIKTPGIYDAVLKVTRDLGCMELVHATGGQVPKGNYALPIPWISGWNYTDGGEEDPERMREVLSRAPKGVYGIMCDDARSIVRALGRRPDLRPFVPFRSTMKERPQWEPGRRARKTSGRHLSSEDPLTRRAACIALSRKPQRSALNDLLRVAEQDTDFTVRQEACWALGSLRDDRAAPTLLRIAKTSYDPKQGAATGYREFFLKVAAACALARLASRTGHEALNELIASPHSSDREAAGIGLAAHGTAKDIPELVRLVETGGDTFVASFAVGYAGRFGEKAIPIYVAALSRDDTAKQAVFGLVSIGPRAAPILRELAGDSAALASIRMRAGLALRWLNDPNL